MAVTKKYAYRRLVKRNGILTVIYVDAKTGQEVTDLTGYIIQGSGTSDQTYDPNTGTISPGDTWPGTPNQPPATQPPPTVVYDNSHSGPGSVGGTSYDPHVQPPATGTAGKAILQLLGNDSPIGKLAHTLIREPNGTGKDTASTGTVGTTPSTHTETVGGTTSTTSAPTDIGFGPAPNVPNGPGLATVTMANQNAHRNLPVSHDLTLQLQAAVTSVYGPDYTVKVISGAQDANSKDHVGTRRHDTGTAADVFVYDASGNEVKGADLLPLGQHWLAASIGSVGFPLNASQSLHLDLLGGNVHGSTPLKSGEGRIWYYGGKPPSSISGPLNDALTKGVRPNYVMDPAQVAELQNQIAQVQAPVPHPYPVTPGVTPQPTVDAHDAHEDELAGILSNLKQTVGDPTPVAPMLRPNEVRAEDAGIPDSISGQPYVPTVTRPLTAPNPAITTGNTINSQQVYPDVSGEMAGYGATRNDIPVQQAGTVQLPAGVRPASVGPENSGDLKLLGSQAFADALNKEAGSIPSSFPNDVRNGVPVNPGGGVIVQEINPNGTAVNSVADPKRQLFMDAYLAEINQAEGNPSYNTLFGGDNFVPSKDHPNMKIAYNDGKNTSSAAGYGQFTYGTWQEINQRYFGGNLSFASLGDQKKAMEKLAEVNYATKTGGRNLVDDLMSGNPQLIGSAFVNNANQWSSLPGGKQPRTSVTEVVNNYQATINDALANRNVSGSPDDRDMHSHSSDGIGTGILGLGTQAIGGVTSQAGSGSVGSGGIISVGSNVGGSVLSAPTSGRSFSAGDTSQVVDSHPTNTSYIVQPTGIMGSGSGTGTTSTTTTRVGSDRPTVQPSNPQPTSGGIISIGSNVGGGVMTTPTTTTRPFNDGNKV